MKRPRNTEQDGFVLAKYLYETYGLRGSGAVFGRRPIKGSISGTAGVSKLRDGDTLWVDSHTFTEGRRGGWFRRMD